MAGLLNNDILFRVDQNGRQLGQEILKAGGSGKAATGARPDAETILACFELHIEQAARLEREQIDIGVVTDIPGIHRYLITVTGQAGHSGTTRMSGRKDALVTASHIILQQKKSPALRTIDNKHFVATIGKIDVWPNGAATVLEVKMVLDMRASSDHSGHLFQKLH